MILNEKRTLKSLAWREKLSGKICWGCLEVFGLWRAAGSHQIVFPLHQKQQFGDFPGSALLLAAVTGVNRAGGRKVAPDVRDC